MKHPFVINSRRKIYKETYYYGATGPIGPMAKPLGKYISSNSSGPTGSFGPAGITGTTNIQISLSSVVGPTGSIIK